MRTAADGKGRFGIGGRDSSELGEGTVRNLGEGTVRNLRNLLELRGKPHGSCEEAVLGQIPDVKDDLASRSLPDHAPILLQAATKCPIPGQSVRFRTVGPLLAPVVQRRWILGHLRLATHHPEGEDPEGIRLENLVPGIELLSASSDPGSATPPRDGRRPTVSRVYATTAFERCSRRGYNYAESNGIQRRPGLSIKWVYYFDLRLFWSRFSCP